MDLELTFLTPLVQSLITQYPIIAKVLIFVGIFRLLMKPLMTLVVKYVELNPDPAKREKIESMLKSKGWKTVAFVIDWLFSVKMPYAPGSLGVRVQTAVQAEKGKDPTQP